MNNSSTGLAARVVSAIAEDAEHTPIPLVILLLVGPFLVNLWRTTLRLTGPSCKAIPGTAGLHNARSPQLNLESLYGDGPTGHPFLYHRDDPAKFLVGPGGADLQRNAEGIAIIGDPRNDSHMLVSQLHLAMLKAHNAFVDESALTDRATANDHVFDEAARRLRWHYQWIILNEFLPTLVGRTLADQVLREGPPPGCLDAVGLYR